MRIALGLQYDGAAFSGWQTQPHGNTVQDIFERALGRFSGAPVATTVAGRTDAGVHALGQVVHFDTTLNRELHSWVRGVNAFLPPSVAVQWAHPVDDAFHARFTAFERCYFYALYCAPTRVPMLVGKAGYLMLPLDRVLDIEAMQTAASYLRGEHDFSAFRSAECQAKSPVKNLSEITIEARGPWVFFRFRANAFLHHMVRNLMGSLLAVGRARQSPQDVRDVIESRDRRLAAPTFLPDGLYLARVAYPPEFGLPEPQLAPSLFHGVFA